MFDKSTREEAQVFLDDASTPEKKLLDLLQAFHLDLSVAEAIARHPACPWNLITRFMYFLPDAVQQNPQLQEHQQHELWETRLKNAKPISIARQKYSPSSYFGSDQINPKYPETYKVVYWLKNGSPADQRMVLEIKKIPLELIAPFLTSKQAPIRQTLAARELLPEGGFETLAKDTAKTVRTALAKNVCTPPHLLAQLTLDPEQEVAQAARANMMCPSDALHQAALKDAQQPVLTDKSTDAISDEELKQLLGDPKTDSEYLARLASHPESWVRAAVGLHSNSKPATLQQIAQSTEPWVRDAVAFNPNASAELLHALLDKSSPDRLLALACNPALPLALQLEIARAGDDRIRWQLADTTENEKVWQEILANTPDQKDHPWRDALAKTLDPKTKSPALNNLQRSHQTRHFFINKISARHVNAAKDLQANFAFYLFDQLTQNPMIALQFLENPQAIRPDPYQDWKVEQWLNDGTAPGMVANYYLQADILNNKRRALNCWSASLRLVQQQTFDTDTLLLKKLAQRKDITRFMFEVLSRSDKPSVREEIAKNPVCPTVVIHRLKQDKIAAVRAAAAQHPAASMAVNEAETPVAQTIESLANKGPKKDRIKMAQRAENSEILSDLANDKAAEVRRAVASNKFTSTKVLDQLAGDADDEVRTAVAYQERASLATIKRLLSDVNGKIRALALDHSLWEKAKSYSNNDDGANYSDRENLLTRFYQDPEIEVRRIVASYTKNPELQIQYAQETDVRLLCRLARNTKVCDAVIQTLSVHPERKVRSDVAYRSRGNNILEHLLNDENEDVVYQAASSLGITSRSEAREKYASHPNPHVRVLISKYINERDKVAVYLTLLQDPNAVDHQSLASSDHLPVKVREFMLEQQHPEMIKQLVRYERLSEEEQKALCLNGSIDVREILAKITELESLHQLLVKDSAASVRKQLAYNYSLAPELLSALKKDTDSEVGDAARLYSVFGT